MEIRVERVDHVQIDVADLERARCFYGEVLGLPEIARPRSFDFAGAWFAIGAVDLHLVVRDPGHPGSRHLCLWVADVRAAAEALAGAGHEVAWDTRYKIEGVDRFFTRDPDGNRVEIQGSDGSGSSRWERERA